MEVQNEVVTTLMKARDIIKNGWCQGQLCVADRYCVRGAIMQASGSLHDGGNPENNRRYTAADDVVVAVLGVNAFTGVPNWNDDPNRTHAEVVELFDKAIEKEMSKCLTSS